ncbi:MAG TPA: YlxR family protein [Kofleriaceae bacterium]|jgi:predicted RNA-binding protein YlxR (DUF448 family)|nr:YlxR family protein [Kofleriaceae bacterium]
MRTCVGCRRTDRQDALVRVVRGGEGAVADVRRRLPGRGAWLHRSPSCLGNARGGLSRALRMSVTDRDVAAVRAALMIDSPPLPSRVLPRGATPQAGTPASAAPRLAAAPTDPARDTLGATASDSGLLRRDAVDNATRSKAQE